jgi:hypothetical protein
MVHTRSCSAGFCLAGATVHSIGNRVKVNAAIRVRRGGALSKAQVAA